MIWIDDWELGLGIGIGHWDWALGLELWIGDWYLRLGIRHCDLD